MTPTPMPALPTSPLPLEGTRAEGTRAEGTRAAPRTIAGMLRAYLELGKLRLSGLAVFAVLAGLWMGSPGTPALGLVLGTTLGTLLAAAGGSALNMYRERDHDRLMRRTRSRPLPTGRLTPGEVLAFGLCTSAAGVLVLLLATNVAAAAVCAAINVTYVLVYTPLKRRTHLNTLVGAVPGALPPVVGYAAATGQVLDATAVLLFLILYFWQVPHFLAIAWRYREEYRRGGMQMLPVVDPDGSSTSLQMMIYVTALVGVSLAPPLFGVTHSLYAVVALLLGVLFMVPTFMAAILRWESAMRQCFLASIVYLPLLLATMVLDRTIAV